MRYLAVTMLAALAAVSMGAGGLSPDSGGDAEPRARNLTVGVNLVTWDSTKPEGGWQRVFPRSEISPGFGVDISQSVRGVPGLRLAGGGKRFVYGGWRYVVPTIQEKRPYRFRAAAEVKGVPSIRRNILCRVQWTGSDLGNEMTPSYVNTFERGQGYTVTFDQIFEAPPGATGAVVDLFIQWVPGADVTFKDVTFETARPDRVRTARVATVYWRPTSATTPAQNIEGFAAMVDKAAERHPDVILLGETITCVGIGLTAPGTAEELPGPTFLTLAARARKYNCYIIYGALEQSGGAIYNSAFIIDRKGTLAGTYRKVQLPVGEVDAGLAPGDLFQTFQLDFGRVGILICHDTAFSEPARVLTIDGAEIIFVPIWGGDLTQLKTRALDNGVWVVTSGYDVPSTVIDPAGEIRAITWKEGIGDGVADHLINLTERVRRPWIGDWNNQVLKQRRTDAYMKLVEE